MQAIIVSANNIPIKTISLSDRNRIITKDDILEYIKQHHNKTVKYYEVKDTIDEFLVHPECTNDDHLLYLSALSVYHLVNVSAVPGWVYGSSNTISITESYKEIPNYLIGEKSIQIMGPSDKLIFDRTTHECSRCGKKCNVESETRFNVDALSIECDSCNHSEYLFDTKYGLVQPEHFNRCELTITDIDDMINSINSINGDPSALRNFYKQYNVRNFHVQTYPRPSFYLLLNEVVKTDNYNLIKFIYSKLIYDDSFYNLHMVQISSVKSQRVCDLLLKYIRKFQRGYVSDLEELRISLQAFSTPEREGAIVVAESILNSKV
jgi:hypothetical protein